MSEEKSFIAYCVYNKVIAHIIMLLIIVLGIVGALTLQTQLIPNLTIPQVITNFVWPNASSQQIEKNIIVLAENSIDGIQGLKTITSIAKPNQATMILEFEPQHNIFQGKNEVDARLSMVDFPDTLEKHQTQTVEAKEQIARLLVSQPDPKKLQQTLITLQSSLKNYGLASTVVTGDLSYQLNLVVDPKWLLTQKTDLHALSMATAKMLRELPAGFVGDQGIYAATEVGLTFEDVLQKNWSVTLNDQVISAHTIFKTINYRPSETSPRLFSKGHPVAEIIINRGKNQDLLTAAKDLEQWFLDQDTLPSPTLKLFDQSWTYFWDRLTLLGRNGITGLILIGCLLSLFLNPLTAFWVGCGVLVSLLGTLALLYPLGAQINMISLFAMILSLGIIVDDAIVVSEKHTSLSRFMDTSKAAVVSASMMVRPLMASSLTTVAAFFPLLSISGITGQFLKEIPLVVITVIMASLIECFFILPKHLSHTPPKRRITRFQRYFRYLRIHYFLKIIQYALKQPIIILSSALVFIILTVSFIAHGHIKFSFFPNFSSDQIAIEVDFYDAASFSEKRDFLTDLETKVMETLDDLSPNLYQQTYVIMNQQVSEGFNTNPILNGIKIWLTDQDKRTLPNTVIMRKLQEQLSAHPLVKEMIIDQPRGGPPSDLIQIEMSGEKANLEKAMIDLRHTMNQYQGVYNLRDDLTSLVPNYYFTLNPATLFAGMNHHLLYTQLASLLSESKQFTLTHDNKTIDVMIQLPDENKDLKQDLMTLPIKLPNGTHIPLSALATMETQYTAKQLIRKNKQQIVTFSAQINSEEANTYQINEQLEQSILPKIEKTYGIKTQMGTVQQDQMTTLNELLRGAIVGIFCIYLILTWSTSSFSVPFAILLTVPLCLMGGILGHGILRFDITLLSLFGFFGLVGVTVNDSIILVLQYQKLNQERKQYPALIQATCERFRPILLTSLTTVGGLLPLLFETSYQAQFLIPMAITIAFGLLFGTLWILVLLPVILLYLG